MKKTILTALIVFSMSIISCEITPSQTEIIPTVDSTMVDSTLLFLDSISTIDSIK